MDAAASFTFDPDFEFSAPHFYDFTSPETASEVEEAECWFETSASHGASPFLIRLRDLNFTPYKTNHESGEDEMDVSNSPRHDEHNPLECRIGVCDVRYGLGNSLNINEDNVSRPGDLKDLDLSSPEDRSRSKDLAGIEKQVIFSPGSLPAKRAYTEMSKKPPMTDKPVSKYSKNYLSRQTHETRHEIQAIKKQKLEGGRLKPDLGEEIWRREDLKEEEKQPPFIINLNDGKHTTKTQPILTVPKAFNFLTERRLLSAKGSQHLSALKAGKPSSPYVSMAEKVQRFQTRTRDFLQSRLISQEDCGSGPLEKPKLKLTRPKEPEFETSQRVRPARVKSTAELEAEMLAKMPKFKARPLNKKILEAPTIPALPKTIPVKPEFQEFHLRTMDRALQHCGAASLASASSADSATFEECRQRRKSAPGGVLSEPQEPHLETAARARPPKVKNSEEREQEELARIPKFKARPLDKKIFWSRGDLGIFRNTKRQATTPVEFQFATSERIHSQPHIPLDLFSKLSLNSQQENQPPKPTKPEPFHLLTEDRGQKREQRMLMELKENEFREQEQRIPKANPLPCTTDYPEIPPKPDPKLCTKPQPFSLESVARHEEELQRVAEENRRIEREEAERRRFHAQPILCNGPVFVPERSRKPLTEVHEFALQVDARATERADFDRRVTEKQNSYKRFREEYETARKADEERLIKSLRRTMVPHARPLPGFDKPFVPRRCSKELTRPRSPKLSVSHRRDRRSSLTFRRQSMTFTVQKRLQMR